MLDFYFSSFLSLISRISASSAFALISNNFFIFLSTWLLWHFDWKEHNTFFVSRPGYSGVNSNTHLVGHEIYPSNQQRIVFYQTIGFRFTWIGQDENWKKEISGAEYSGFMVGLYLQSSSWSTIQDFSTVGITRCMIQRHWVNNPHLMRFSCRLNI